MLVRDLAKTLNKTNKQILAVLEDNTKTQASKLTDEEVEKVIKSFEVTPKEEPVKTETVKKVVTTRTFNSDDPISCRSITAGELILVGKSGINYSWYAAGDVTDVRYDDILALKYARSPMLTFPRFVIEDEDLLNDPKFADLKEMYNKIYSADVEEILQLTNDEFVEVLTKAPDGLKNAIKVTVATKFEHGEFDSLSKIQSVEQICGAEILNLK